MKKLLTLTAAGAALMLAAGVATSAGAVTYTGSYTITDNVGNNFLGTNGLLVQTSNDLNDPFSFSLSGNSTNGPVDLFDIWTDEQELGSDDLNNKGIKVTFSFTQPGNLGGDVNGQTFGVDGTVNSGKVTWNGPLVLNFGAETLTITLGSATFNSMQDTTGRHGCDNCLDYGFDQHADVTATFTQTVTGGVPEPASWALMIGGFGMAGAALRRRRTAVAAAA